MQGNQVEVAVDSQGAETTEVCTESQLSYPHFASLRFSSAHYHSSWSFDTAVIQGGSLLWALRNARWSGDLRLCSCVCTF